jgi:hypothetical protein
MITAAVGAATPKPAAFDAFDEAGGGVETAGVGVSAFTTAPSITRDGTPTTNARSRQRSARHCFAMKSRTALEFIQSPLLSRYFIARAFSLSFILSGLPLPFGRNTSSSVVSEQ